MSELQEKESPSERIHGLERKAQAIRTRLARVLDILDARRHRAMTLGTYAKAAVRPVLFTALGAVVIVGGAVLAVGAIARARRRRELPALASRAISKFVQRLELVPRPSMGLRVFEKAVATLATMAATELVGAISRRAAPDRAIGPRVY